MANPVNTPEFRQILRDVIDEGYRGKGSGAVMLEAWRRYRQTVGHIKGNKRRKCKVCGKLFASGETKHVHPNPLRKFDPYSKGASSAGKLLNEIYMKHGKEAGFVANVIWGQHSNKTAKIKGLWNLLESGHEVRIAGNSIDILMIDGNKASWIDLEKAAKVSKNPIAIYNPPSGKTFYGRIVEIKGIKTTGEHRGKGFVHRFKTVVKAIGLKDGSVMLRSSDGSRLWDYEKNI